MSLPLPNLTGADEIEIAAEVTVTNTCVEPGPRCVGRPYRYSARSSAPNCASPRGARRPGAPARVAISRRQKVHCGQQRPDRNHHCPIIFSLPPRPLERLGALPCRLTDCRLNLVLDAHHRDARRGNRLVVGADRPDGSVSQDRGRLSAIVFRDGFETPAVETSVDRRQRRHVRMVTGPLGGRSGGHTVIYSARVPTIEQGTVISATAKQRLAIGRLRYSAFVSTELILSSRPARTTPDAVAKRAATFNGHLTETTGFNCTQGPSAFRTPCVSEKAGVAVLRNKPTRDGEPVPLYVNLVSRTFPKLTKAKPGDRAKVLAGGGLDVVAYPHAREQARRGN